MRASFLRWYFPFCLALLAGLLTACNDKPSPLGSEFITDTLSTKVISTTQATLVSGTANGTYKLAISNGGDKANTNSFLTGIAHNTQAMAMIRFAAISDTLKSQLKNTEIFSVKLKIYPLKYAFGDTTSGNKLKFNVVEVQKTWLPSATTDSVNNSYFGTDVLFSCDQSVKFGDSLPPVEIPFDKTKFLDWIQRNELTSFGLAFQPDAASTVLGAFSMIGIGDDASRASTRIEVAYRRPGTTDVTDTLNVQSIYANTFVTSSFADAGDIVMQGGIAARSHLYFDVSAIPLLSAIHKAELRLTVDEQQSRFGSTGMDTTLIARFALDSTFTSQDYSFYLATLSGNEYVFRSISSAVERWVRGSKNYGLILQTDGTREIHETNRLVLHGLQDPDPSKRPKLTIVYSSRPK